MSIWIVVLVGSFLCQMSDAVEGQPRLADQTPRLRGLYHKHAKNWIRLGNVYWSIEVKQQAQIKASSSVKKREPYEQDNAPYFYEPLEKIKAHSLDEIAEKTTQLIKLDNKTSIGKEMEHGVLIKLSNRRTIMLLTDDPDSLTRLDGYALATGKRVAKDQNKKSSSTTLAVYQYHPKESVAQSVTAQALYAYFQRHGLVQFPILRPKKVWDQRATTKKTYTGPGTLRRPQIQTRPEKYHFKWIDYPLRAK